MLYTCTCLSILLYTQRRQWSVSAGSRRAHSPSFGSLSTGSLMWRASKSLLVLCGFRQPVDVENEVIFNGQFSTQIVNITTKITEGTLVIAMREQWPSTGPPWQVGEARDALIAAKTWQSAQANPQRADEIIYQPRDMECYPLRTEGAITNA